MRNVSAPGRQFTHTRELPCSERVLVGVEGQAGRASVSPGLLIMYWKDSGLPLKLEAPTRSDGYKPVSSSLRHSPLLAGRDRPPPAAPPDPPPTPAVWHWGPTLTPTAVALSQ